MSHDNVGTGEQANEKDPRCVPFETSHCQAKQDQRCIAQTKEGCDTAGAKTRFKEPMMEVVEIGLHNTHQLAIATGLVALEPHSHRPAPDGQ